MHLKLAAIDLDGTLLDDNKQVSHADLAAIEKLLRRGVTIALATARDCASIQLKVPLALPGLYLLGSGGALIYDVAAQKIRWAEYLSPHLVESGVAYLKGFGHPVFLNAFNDYWVDRYNERVQMIEQRYNLKTLPFTNASEVNQELMRVSLAAPAAMLKQAAEGAARGAAEFSDRLTVSLASPDWLDLLALGAGKGPALVMLQSMLDIDSEHTLAIGDYDCDLALFAHARWRVAMGNAVPAVKEAATSITASNNENGVAQALSAFLE
jgi:Cof subfamily protein (haloacid dehalogenase superfamily)